MLDTADVQVDATGMIGSDVGTWAHSVALDLGIDELVLVRRVQVAQLVPARAGPLRHHVGVAPVLLRSVAEIELDVHPSIEPVERALGIGELVVGVERALLGVSRLPGRPPRLYNQYRQHLPMERMDMAARALSSATISFVLVSVPVKLYSAGDTSGSISFNWIRPNARVPILCLPGSYRVEIVDRHGAMTARELAIGPEGCDLRVPE